MTEALEGIKVLDLSRYAPGPFCTMILGDFGADIIKVEEAGALSGRRAEQMKGAVEIPVVREYSFPDSPYDPVNRNKKSLALNLKSEEGREIFYKLAEKADVVVEGFRPGVTERLGIGYETLKGINPGIIYCAITGYGQDGPYKDLVGHDINYIAQGGLLDLMEFKAMPGNLVGDIAGGGVQAVVGILLALNARARTGKGQFVDISMSDGVVSLLSLYIGGYFQNGSKPRKEDRVSLGAMHFYNFYETKDGKHISLGCSEPWFFANLCKVLGCEEYISEQTNLEKIEEIKEFFRKTFLTRSRDEWFDLLSRSDIAVSKVNSIDELSEDPHLKFREMIVELDHPREGKVKHPGISIKLSDTPGSIKHFSPRTGEHSEAILTEAGWSREEIARLIEEGVVKTAQ